MCIKLISCSVSLQTCILQSASARRVVPSGGGGVVLVRAPAGLRVGRVRRVDAFELYIENVEFYIFLQIHIKWMRCMLHDKRLSIPTTREVCVRCGFVVMRLVSKVKCIYLFINKRQPFLNSKTIFVLITLREHEEKVLLRRTNIT